MLIELKNGRRVKYPKQVGKVLVARGLGVEVTGEDSAPAQPTYQTRMMQAAPVTAAADPAPYGYKADGTPRKRPGRPAVVKASEEE